MCVCAAVRAASRRVPAHVNERDGSGRMKCAMQNTEGKNQNRFAAVAFPFDASPCATETAS